MVNHIGGSLSSWIQSEWFIQKKHYTSISLNAIYNSLQSHTTACESQSTACDIEMVGDALDPHRLYFYKHWCLAMRAFIWNILFQIKQDKKLYIAALRKKVAIHCKINNLSLVEEGSGNRKASRDEFVETGDASVETGMNLSNLCKNTTIMLWFDISISAATTTVQIRSFPANVVIKYEN